MRSWKQIIVVLFLAVGLVSCSFYDDVELVSVQDVEVLEFSQDIIHAHVDLELKNPNWYNVKVIDSELELFLNGKRMGKVRLGEKVTIPRNSTSIQRVHILSDVKEFESNFLQNVLTLLFNKSTKMEIKGWIEGRGFVVKKRVPILIEEDINPRDFGL
ncbi:MAG: LEA type 2 family protein [Flavobacteriales bacterium]|nr:LEA type 2 family protein [Flavobacteriales bacterium]